LSEKAAPAPVSELALRVASAIALAAVALAALYVGGVSFAILCAIFAALIAYEFRGIVGERLPGEISIAILVLFALTIALWFAAGPEHSALALAGGVVLLAAWELLQQRSAWAAAALAYSVLPFLALAMVRGSDPAGAMVVLLLFAVVWGADIFAYFAGRAIGGPKLAPRISPKKTWAGFFGGIAGSLVLAIAVALVFDISIGAGLLGAAVAVSVVSQIGDLCESWLKRHFGKKDSSNLIPGHGGVMDRLDGLVFAAVAAWIAAVGFGAEALAPDAPARALSETLIGG
jgi:phosphatidate cytidylyltransferase